ncbi:hypothetical protein A2U01_0062145, partial [Trifolium medium]|nr:hypothetical protein [Trifolium medium]
RRPDRRLKSDQHRRGGDSRSPTWRNERNQSGSPPPRRHEDHRPPPKERPQPATKKRGRTNPREDHRSPTSKKGRSTQRLERLDPLRRITTSLPQDLQYGVTRTHPADHSHGTS